MAKKIVYNFDNGKTFTVGTITDPKIIEREEKYMMDNAFQGTSGMPGDYLINHKNVNWIKISDDIPVVTQPDSGLNIFEKILFTIWTSVIIILLLPLLIIAALCGRTARQNLREFIEFMNERPGNR